MKLRKIFKYGFLAICLLGKAIAMDKIETLFSLESPYKMKDMSGVVVSHLSFQERMTLARTCKSWNSFIKSYHDSMVPFKIFEEININIHPDLFHKYCGEIINLSCTPQSLCIFLPFQENTATEKATTWDQTTGWSINGYTGKIQKLAPFSGDISWCCNNSHPQGIILGALNQPVRVLTLDDGTIKINLAFPGIEEAEGFGDIFPNFLCNMSNVVFILNQNNQDMISCYKLNQVQQKRVANLPSHNSRAFNFGEKFLVMGSFPNSLHVINPELDPLIEKPIGLPGELTSQDVVLLNLTSDRDSVLISAQNHSILNNQISYFVITNISGGQPITKPVFFLSKGYKSVGCYLKNDYIISIASRIEEEVTGSPEIGNTSDVKIDEKRGLFTVHDLNEQLIYKKFFQSIPLETYCVGNTIFVKSITEEKKTWIFNGDCWYWDSTNSIQSLSAFNIKNFLI